MKDLTATVKTIQLLEEKVSVKLHDWIGNSFLDLTPNTKVSNYPANQTNNLTTYDCFSISVESVVTSSFHS